MSRDLEEKHRICFLLLSTPPLNMWGYAALCGAMRGYAVLCGAMRRYAALCGAMRRYAALCGAMRRYAVLCGAMRCYAVLCGPVKIHAPYCLQCNVSAGLQKHSSSSTPAYFNHHFDAASGQRVATANGNPHLDAVGQLWKTHGLEKHEGTRAQISTKVTSTRQFPCTK